MTMDIRTRYTRQALTDALFELLETRPLEQVTVKELCSRAGVNKSTLYAHFSGVRDVFVQGELAFVEETVAMDLQLPQRAEECGSLDDAYLELCEFYLRNRSRFLAIVRNDPDYYLTKGEQYASTVLALQGKDSQIAQLDEHRQELGRLMMSTTNAAFVHLIQAWLVQYQNLSPTSVSHLLSHMMPYAKKTVMRESMPSR